MLRSRVTSARAGAARPPATGWSAPPGLVAGRPIACYAQDGRYLGGSLGERHADTIVRVLQTAERARIPVVAFVESGGARMQEGTAALAGYGRIFRQTVQLTGVVPQLSVVSGASAGGGAYSPALTDLIVMTEDAAMFLTGPGVVRDALGEEIDAAALGGPRVHDRNGVCQLVEADELSAARRMRELLGYLPSAAGDPVPRALVREPALADPGSVVPSEPRRAYDVRAALQGMIDADSLLELSPRWARNLVTALARIDGRPVGIVANQPHHLGGVLDAEGSEKAARFVGFCDSFGLPLVVVVDTPGFMPGSRQERAGVIRHGAAAGPGVRLGPRAEAHRRAAQVLRRRLHHHELARSRRRSGPGLARGRAGDHERPRRGRLRQPSRAAAGRRPGGRARAPGRRLRAGAPAGRRGGRGRLRRRDHRAGETRAAAGRRRCARSPEAAAL